jgi:MSHA biogenesis protein MshK
MDGHVSPFAKAITLACGWLAMSLLISAAYAESLQDPTRPPDSLTTGLAGNAVAQPSGPVLQSVLISPARKVAVISGQTVKLGEKYGKSVVVGISENEVVLQNGKELQTLKLYPNIHKRLTSTAAGEKTGQRR